MWPQRPQRKAWTFRRSFTQEPQWPTSGIFVSYMILFSPLPGYCNPSISIWLASLQSFHILCILKHNEIVCPLFWIIFCFMKISIKNSEHETSFIQWPFAAKYIYHVYPGFQGLCTLLLVYKTQFVPGYTWQTWPDLRFLDTV